MKKTAKDIILEKVKSLQENHKQLGNEIQELDRLMAMKKSDYLRIEGAIQGLNITLSDLRAEEKEEIEIDEEDEE